MKGSGLVNLLVVFFGISLAKGDYVLRFETGNLTDSDTHAQVYFRLHGTVGNASDIVNVNGGNFTIGGHTTVSYVGDHGNLGTVTIGHDNTGPSPDWYLHYFEIEDLTRRITYMFPCECWFSDATVLERDPTWPVAGVWSQWSNWSLCDLETLTRSRNRSCENPQFGGSCPGPEVETTHCNPVVWSPPFDNFTGNLFSANQSECLDLKQPLRDNIVHVANITMEANPGSDVIISLTTTVAVVGESCQDTGVILTHESATHCPSDSVTLTTCPFVAAGVESNNQLLCSYACPCDVMGCTFAMYYLQFKHFVNGYQNARELCKISIQ